MKIILLCTGNICRSPMAEGLLRDLLDRHRLHHIRTDSAGTHDYHYDDAPDRRAIAVMRDYGHDISALRARLLTTDDLAAADNHILCAATEHLHAAVRLKERSGGKATVSKMLDTHPEMPGADLPDPYYGDRRDFEQVYALLLPAFTRFIQTLTTAEDTP